MATKKAAKKPATAKPPTKSEVYAAIAEKTGLAKKQVAGVFEALAGVAAANLGKKGSGVFVVPPGLLKLTVKNIPAKPAGKRMDPFTKTEKLFPAKPASKRVRARPMKSLKDMV
jgi:nucleoid DNA-binding protein